MPTTEFLDDLNAVEADEYTGEIVTWLERVKGVKNARDRLLGWEPDEDDEGLRHYAAVVDDGLLWLAVKRREDGTIARRVTDFTQDPLDLVDMLGEERMTESMKQALARKLERHPVVGQRLTGVVTNIRDDIGIFVRIREGITGLVYIDELPDSADFTPSLAAQVGDEIDVYLKSIHWVAGQKRWDLTMRGPIS